MTSVRIGLAALTMALVVSGCAVRDTRPAGAWLDERQAWFDRHPQWSVDGRVALSDGARGGSLAFDWVADGPHHRVGLRTLTGGRQWRLEFGPGYAVLEGSEVERLVGIDPDPLVEYAVGWPVPVSLMADWVRGLPAPPDARVAFAADGTLDALQHQVWNLDFQRYQAGTDGILLPARLEAQSGQYRIRVVLRNWHVATHGDVQAAIMSSSGVH